MGWQEGYGMRGSCVGKGGCRGGGEGGREGGIELWDRRARRNKGLSSSVLLVDAYLSTPRPMDDRNWTGAVCNFRVTDGRTDRRMKKCWWC